MVQLWVNLPARHKRTPPRYQEIRDADVPAVPLPHLEQGRGTVRVIAGELLGRRGPAHTFTPMEVWDVALETDERTVFALPDGWTAALVVLHGTIRVAGSEPIGEAEVALFDRAGTRVTLDGASGARLLLLSGEPIDEPIVGAGPFVMNTEDEIRQALADYRAGRMGHLS
jgi:redox-sensitive bicupin YhaK (pirin superfamily)